MQGGSELIAVDTVEDESNACASGMMPIQNVELPLRHRPLVSYCSAHKRHRRVRRNLLAIADLKDGNDVSRDGTIHEISFLSAVCTCKNFPRLDYDARAYCIALLRREVGVPAAGSSLARVHRRYPPQHILVICGAEEDVDRLLPSERTFLFHGSDVDSDAPDARLEVVVADAPLEPQIARLFDGAGAHADSVAEPITFPSVHVDCHGKAEPVACTRVIDDNALVHEHGTDATTAPLALLSFELLDQFQTPARE